MNKSLAIPHKVDGRLLETMTKHLGGNKDDAEPTELFFYQPVKGGGAVLKPTAVSDLVVI